MTLLLQGRPARPLLITLICLVLAAAFAVGLQARERASSQERIYRYTVLDGPSSASCTYDYIQLGSDAPVLPLLPTRDDAAADDGATLVTLAEPFELYQTPVQALVVSGNGYLAAADSLAVDDGSDFSNDCELPARADNPAASQNRIYVYHDDLRPQRGGEVRQRYFPTCPRAGLSASPESCTVVEWNRFERAEPIRSTRPLQVQAVLYHSSQAIALQYASVDDSQASQATIGVQGFDGRAATQAGCNRRRQVASGQAVCFFDPRHRPSGQLAGLGAP